MNLKGFNLSNFIVIIGTLVLILTGVIEWYIGLLIIIYLLEIRLK